MSPPCTCALSCVPCLKARTCGLLTLPAEEGGRHPRRRLLGPAFSLTPASSQTQTPLALPHRCLQTALTWASTASVGTLTLAHPGPQLCLIAISLCLAGFPHPPEAPDEKSSHTVPLTH